MEDIREFITEVCRKRGTKKHFKVRNSWGIRNAYKLIRKNRWFNIGRPLKEGEFYAIIRGINRLLADNLANGETVVFPESMGKLELRKWERGVSIVNDKLKITYPIDWEGTLKLWYEDREAMKSKTLLRNNNKDVFSIKYSKFGADYENNSFYEFTLNRFIKIALKKNIQEDKIDSLW